MTRHQDECALHPLFALYDTLNDDDNEIRDLSALTVSILQQKSLVPLEARVELVSHIKHLYGSSLLFYWSSICRMTGNDLYESDARAPVLESAEAQFSRALKDDDSLFVEEEQNLFIDEVRETRLWAKAFEETGLQPHSKTDVHSSWGKAYTDLALWVTDGLATMASLLDRDDGPLGWTSRPAVFAVCMRVLLSAKAITLHNERWLMSDSSQQDHIAFWSEDIAAALKRFNLVGREKNIHGSLIFGV
jgi:hypothetical protein